MIFDEKNWLSQIFSLFTPPHYNNLQNSMISFDYSWFLSQKTFLIFYPSCENSTNGIATVLISSENWGMFQRNSVANVLFIGSVSY